MKNIIIAGSSRAGKSTLARKLNDELGYFILGVDKIVATFGRAYPDMNVRLNWDYNKTTVNIAPFIGHLLGVFSTDYRFNDEQNLQIDYFKENKFALEGCYLDFEKISSILNMYGIEKLENNFILIGLVQNHKTVAERYNDFKIYDTVNDWTYELSDEDLLGIAKDAVSENQNVTEYLIKWDFTIYDTSNEREHTLNQIIEDIKLKCNIKY